MTDKKQAAEIAISAGFERIANAFPSEIDTAFSTANSLRNSIVRPTDASEEPVMAYCVNDDSAAS